jgi:hypothetical protein
VVKKSSFILIGLIFISCGLKSQDIDTSVTVNSLRAPSSPAFVIMGLQPSNIENPTDPADFIVSLRNATDNFSTLPRNFAMEFAPGWVFCGRKITYKNFQSNNIGQNIWQGSTISFGVNTLDLTDSTSITQSGFGFKMPIFRGNLDSNYKDYHKKMTMAMAMLKVLNNSIGDEAIKRKDNDPVLQLLNKQLLDPAITEAQITMIEVMMGNRNKQIDKEVTDEVGRQGTEIIDSLKLIAQSLEVRRWGFKLDLAGAMELDFLQQQFNNSKISKYGIWLTGGYEFEKMPIVLLGVARFLNNPDQQYIKDDSLVKKNNLEGDLGARLVIDNIKHFSISGEIVYRTSFNIPEIKPTWRYVLNIDYQFAFNKLLSFSFGRNFDGTQIKGGTLVAALNLVLGFGSKRRQ